MVAPGRHTTLAVAPSGATWSLTNRLLGGDRFDLGLRRAGDRPPGSRSPGPRRHLQDHKRTRVSTAGASFRTGSLRDRGVVPHPPRSGGNRSRSRGGAVALIGAESGWRGQFARQGHALLVGRQRAASRTSPRDGACASFGDSSRVMGRPRRSLLGHAMPISGSSGCTASSRSGA